MSSTEIDKPHTSTRTTLAKPARISLLTSNNHHKSSPYSPSDLSQRSFSQLQRHLVWPFCQPETLRLQTFCLSSKTTFEPLSTRIFNPSGPLPYNRRGMQLLTSLRVGPIHWPAMFAMTAALRHVFALKDSRTRPWCQRAEDCAVLRRCVVGRR